MEHLCKICNINLIYEDDDFLCKRCSSFVGTVKNKKLFLSIVNYLDNIKTEDLFYSYDGELKKYKKDREKQERYKCPVCKNRYSKSKHSSFYATIDHDHNNGKIRDVVCHRCNTAIGQFEAIMRNSNLSEKQIVENILKYKKWDSV